MVFNYLETLGKTHHSRQTRAVQSRKHLFFNAPIHQIAILINTNPDRTGSHTENPSCYQQFDLRQKRIHRRSQPIVDFDAADNSRSHVTTLEAMIFQDDILSTPSDIFKNHHLILIDLTSVQNANVKCHYPELVGETLRLELSFFSL